MARWSVGARVCDPDKMNFQRIAARFVVVCGGLFWMIAAFSGQYVFQGIALTDAVGSALVPLAITVIVFAVGWFSEGAAAAVLSGLSVGGVAWGMLAGWDPLVWALMATFFIAPMVVAGTLYVLAWRMEATCGGAERALRLLAAPETPSQ